MPSEARQKKIMEKLNRAQKCSILGPQNLGSRGGPGPGPPPGSAPVLSVLIKTKQDEPRMPRNNKKNVTFTYRSI